MTFAASLESMSDDDLVALVNRRSDVIGPYFLVGSFDRLADQLSSWHSQSSAMGLLDRFESQVFDLAVLVGERGTVTDLVDESAGALDVVDAAAGVDALRSVGLLWLDGDGSWHLPGQIRAQYTTPAGLRRPFHRLTKPMNKAVLEGIARGLDADVESTAKGRSSGAVGPPLKDDYVRGIASVLSDRNRVEAVLSDCPDAPIVKRYLASIDDGRATLPMPHRYTRPGQPPPGEEWLADHGLLVEAGGFGEIPREVGLAFRGGRPFAEITRNPPPLIGVSAGPPGSVDRASAAAVMRLLETMTGLLLCARDTPIKLNKSGDMGVRAAKTLASSLDVEVRDVMRAVELAVGAALLEVGYDRTGSRLVDDERGRIWLEAPPNQQWLCLIDAWLNAPALFGAAGGRDRDDKNMNALRRRTFGVQTLAVARRGLLELLAGLDADRAPEPGSLADHTRFARPTFWSYDHPDITGGGTILEVTLAEAEYLGVTGAGGLASPVHALLDGDKDRAADDAAAHLPSVVDRLVIQADLTILAPGPVSSALARAMGAMAEVESRGGATTWRLSEASIRTAIDDGWAVAHLLAVLEDHGGPLPQPVRYLFDDVARRHGHLRVRPVRAIVRCDDEALLAAAVGHRKVSAMLELIAPTVAVAGDHGADSVLDRLREAGFLPTIEGAGGEIVTLQIADASTDVDTGARPDVDHDPTWWQTSTDSGMSFDGTDAAADLVAQLRSPTQAQPELPFDRFQSLDASSDRTDLIEDLLLARKIGTPMWLWMTDGRELFGTVRTVSQSTVVVDCGDCPEDHIVPLTDVDDCELDVWE